MSRDDGGQDGQTVAPSRCHRPVPGTCEVNGRPTPGPPPDNRVSRTAARTRSLSARDAVASPTVPPGQPPSEARGRLPHPGQQGAVRVPRPAPVGDLDPDHAVPRPDRDRDRSARSARSARPTIPDPIAEKLGHQQGGVVPARVPGTKYPTYEGAGNLGPLRPSGKRHAFPNSRPSHQRTCPSPPAPGRSPGRRADTQGMHAQLSGTRQAGTRDRRGPSVAVRGSRRLRRPS